MKDSGRILRLALLLAMRAAIFGSEAGAQPPDRAEVLVVRLVHPERQAAEVLRLFEGARWNDPAAALAAWKQDARDSGQLGKAAEAVIALFNPEMTSEWSALDGAEVRIAFDASTGRLGWFALIPRDDGTVAAGLTAARLTNPDDRPIAVDGRALAVARLGRSGVPLACQVGTTVVLAGSRHGLEQGAALANAGRIQPPAGSTKASGALAGDEDRRTASSRRIDSGTVFRLEPGRMAIPRNAPLAQRRMIESLQAIGTRRVEGTASLQAGTLMFDVTTTLEPSRRVVLDHRHPGVDRSWLEALPSAGVMAMISMAIDPQPSSWDWAFAVADRVERVDPARSGLAPLRSRLNLMFAAAGMKLEADLHPHLRGLSACLIGDTNRPGRVTGGLIILHLDDPTVADRLVRGASPRLGALLGANAAARAVTIRCRDRDVWIAWGDGTAAANADRLDPGRSLATVCGGWAGEGRQPPARVGAFWPSRLWRPARVADLPPAALRVLAEDPPVVWWGWSEPGRERDLIQWHGLRERVRKFLESLAAGVR